MIYSASMSRPRFLLPVFQTAKEGTAAVDSWPFIRKVLELSKNRYDDPLPARNVVAFFDNSAGSGKAPDAVPEIPAEYQGKVVGFTGGITSSNVNGWLPRHGFQTLSWVNSYKK